MRKSAAIKITKPSLHLNDISVGQMSRAMEAKKNKNNKI